MLELYGKPLEEIPIKKPTEDIRSQIVDAVDKIINNGSEGEEQKIIDNLIYELYGLTNEEIALVEGGK